MSEAEEEYKKKEREGKEKKKKRKKKGWGGLKSRQGATRRSENRKDRNLEICFLDHWVRNGISTISQPMVEKTEFEISVFSIFAPSGRTLSGLQPPEPL